MKEVNVNIIYTKTTPTEYIGEFVVNPEETTDYEIRAINDETVVEKCEVQVEKEDLPAFSVIFNNGEGDVNVTYNEDVYLQQQSNYFEFGLHFEDNVSREVNYKIFTIISDTESEIEAGSFSSNGDNVIPQLDFEDYDKVVIKFEDLNFKFYVNYTPAPPTPPFDELIVYVNDNVAENNKSYTALQNNKFSLSANDAANYVIFKPVGTGAMQWQEIISGTLSKDTIELIPLDFDGYDRVMVQILTGVVANDITFYVNKYISETPSDEMVLIPDDGDSYKQDDQP